jgi:hypothetical protein
LFDLRRSRLRASSLTEQRMFTFCAKANVKISVLIVVTTSDNGIYRKP